MSGIERNYAYILFPPYKDAISTISALINIVLSLKFRLSHSYLSSLEALCLD